MTSQNIVYLPRLDHLRFLAAFMILLFHSVKQNTTQPFAIGVDLFFTLSGFIFMHIALSSSTEIKYGRFIYNRFLRIFPLTLFMFFMVITIMADKFHAVDILHLLFLNMTAGTNKFGCWGGNYIAIPWWTISIEFCFYFLFPFLVSFYRKYGLLYIFQFILLTILARVIILYTRGSEDGYWPTFMKIHHSILGHLDTFLIGMIAAILFAQRTKIPYLFKILSSPLTFIASLFLIYFTVDLEFIPCYMYSSLYGIMCGLLLLSYLVSTIRLPSVLNTCLAHLGTISFSIYLSHELFIDLFKKFQVKENLVKLSEMLFPLPTVYVDFIYSLVIYMPIVYAFSLLSYFTIEKPFLSLRKKYV